MHRGPTRRGAALLLAALTVAALAALFLTRERGVRRVRARENAAAPEPSAHAVEERGPGGEEARTARAPGTATIGGTVSGENGGVWGVRIFAVSGEARSPCAGTRAADLQALVRKTVFSAGKEAATRGEDVVATFDLQPGGRETVRVPRFR